MKRKPKPKPKPKRRAWARDGQTGKIVCYASAANTCVVVPLVVPKHTSEAHDKELTRYTKEINAILNNVRRNSLKKGADLHFLSTPRGIMLAWAHCDAVGAEDDSETIKKALGIS